jgi:hypothetical protein
MVINASMATATTVFMVAMISRDWGKIGGLMRSLEGDVERVLNPDRKDQH